VDAKAGAPVPAHSHDSGRAAANNTHGVKTSGDTNMYQQLCISSSTAAMYQQLCISSYVSAVVQQLCISSSTAAMYQQ
jgi:hypothetical protein